MTSGGETPTGLGVRRSISELSDAERDELLSAIRALELSAPIWDYTSVCEGNDPSVPLNSDASTTYDKNAYDYFVELHTRGAAIAAWKMTKVDPSPELPDSYLHMSSSFLPWHRSTRTARSRPRSSAACSSMVAASRFTFGPPTRAPSSPTSLPRRAARWPIVSIGWSRRSSKLDVRRAADPARTSGMGRGRTDQRLAERRPGLSRTPAAQAEARLAKLERVPRVGASTSALTEALRERFVDPLTRNHMLRNLE